jgi:hypothetical protein
MTDPNQFDKWMKVLNVGLTAFGTLQAANPRPRKKSGLYKGLLVGGGIAGIIYAVYLADEKKRKDNIDKLDKFINQ